MLKMFIIKIFIIGVAVSLMLAAQSQSQTEIQTQTQSQTESESSAQAQSDSQTESESSAQAQSKKIADRYFLKGTIASESVSLVLTIKTADSDNSHGGNSSSNASNIGESGDSSNNNSNNSGSILVVEAQYYYNNNQREPVILSGSQVGAFLKLEGSEGELIGEFDIQKLTFRGNMLNTIKNKMEVFNFSANNMKIAHLEYFATDYNNDSFHTESFRIARSVHNPRNIYSVDKINKMLETEASKQSRSASRILLIADEYDYHDSYYYNGRLSCEYIDEDIIAFSQYHRENTGGEGQLEQVFYSIYSIKTGKKLNESLDYIFNNKNNATLISMFKARLAEHYIQNSNNFEISDNYYIDCRGVHFAYNSRELDGLNKDICYVSFSFSELKPFLYKLSF